jgi:hypothetical protein
MFDNPFADQYRFDYSKPSDNEDNDMLNSNEMVNNDDVDDEIIPPVPEFRDASGFSFIVFNDWALSHKCISGGSDLEVRQTFSSKNKLVNVVKR